MKPSNHPDIALAQEWAEELDQWIADHGLKGYDPFDVKQHPWIRATQTRPLLRKATTVLCDLFPYASRSLLGVAETENPKAFALVALASLRFYQLTDDAHHRDRAVDCLHWMRDHATPGYGGLCWGYPWDVHATGLDTPANTPIGVVSAIAGQAFLLAHEVLHDHAWLTDARSVAAFMLESLPRIPCEDDTYCFAYTPGDKRRVHNASLLVAEHLYCVAARTDEAALREAAEPALRWTLNHQHEDGSWYYGEWREDEPFESGILQMVDHHHTGFVLRSLHGIHAVTGDEAVRTAMERGFRYYRNHLTEGEYFVPRNEWGRYPIDIHACAECVLCPAVLSDTVIAARNMAQWSLRWPHFFLRDKNTGATWYRKYPFFTSKLVAPRWGVAWMYYALSEYLYHSEV
jgi:hypothetical protein